MSAGRYSFRKTVVAVAAIGSLTAYSGSDASASPPAPAPSTQTANGQACQKLASAASEVWPNPTTVLTAATFNAASPASAAAPAVPEHCEVIGFMNKRVGTDGKPYSIKFHLRMPTNWNGRFFMEGGGSSNGILSDALGSLLNFPSDNALAHSFAVISTDSGHDNSIDSDPNAQGGEAFGADHQARLDFGYNSYDLVTQFGKAAVAMYYGKPPAKSYFMGCSEGGREAMMMSQRFPTYYDGIVAGDPGMQLPKLGIDGAWTSQAFAAVAPAADANGLPAIGKSFSDPDLMLVRNAILGKCDALDDLTDGLVNNSAACQASFDPATAVNPVTSQPLLCSGAKTDSCLTAGQIGALKRAFAAPVNSSGLALYTSWPWDAGISGISNGTYNQGWRMWWLGSYAAAQSDAQRYTGASQGRWLAVYSTPPQFFAASPGNSAIGTRILQFNFDVDAPKIFATADAYPQSSMQWDQTVSTDLSQFKANGGKLILFHGLSDAAFSANDTISWYTALTAVNGSNTADFSRLFLVPGMNHCRGGPATDRFDMLSPLVNWVENGVAPDSVPATASTPSYFNAVARSRPLCPYPKLAHYSGSGDVDAAASFTCQ